MVTDPSVDSSRGDRLRQTVFHLSETIGERHLGSAGEKETQNFLEKAFQEAGYETARESFTAPGWRYGKHSLTLTSGEVIEAFPCYFSPAANISAPLQLIDPTDMAAHQWKELAGKIAFAGSYDFVQIADTNTLAEELEKAGASAFVINSPYNDTYSTKIVRSPNLKRMPVFTVSQKVALRLAREEGKIVHIQLEAERFAHVSYNIVAKYRPSQSEGKKLVIGAHYDSSPGIPGAADNASGIAVLLELIKMLRGKLKNWEVDFTAFGGEEYGGPGYGIGGFNYWHNHQTEPIQAMICLDGIGAYLSKPGVRIGRSPALRTLAKKSMPRTRPRVLPYRAGSDQGIFHKHGIPTAWFTDGGPANGVGLYPLHSPQDAINLLDFTKLEKLTEDIHDFLLGVIDQGLTESKFESIQICTPNDFAAILQLVRQVWTMGADRQREEAYGRVIANKPWQNRITEAVTDYLNRSDVTCFKIEQNGLLAGFTSCRLDQESRIGEVGYNAVNPSFLGQGFGKALLDHALKFLRTKGAKEVEVVTGLDEGHAAARAVYEAAGFQPFIRSIRYTLRSQD